MIKTDTAEPEISPLLFHAVVFIFQNTVPTLPTMQVNHGGRSTHGYMYIHCSFGNEIQTQNFNLYYINEVITNSEIFIFSLSE